MKLTVINNLYPPYIVGGYEILARDVIEALRLRGHHVDVITGRGSDLPRDSFTHGVLDLDLDRKDESFLGGRTPTPLDAWRWHVYSRRSHVAVSRLLHELQPDLVVVWNLYMASMAPLVAARQSGIPLVVNIADKWMISGLHDVSPLIRPSRWRAPFVGLARAVVQPLLRRASRPDHIIAVSEFMRREYQKAGFDGTIETIHLGVPLGRFAPGHPSPSGSGVRFLFVGSLWEGKGPQVAIRALARVVQQPGNHAATLDIYGDGATGFVEFLKALIREHQLEDRVTLRGFVSRNDLPDIYRSHDVLLFPSVWDEPFAAVPLEGMASGLPVVGSTAGGTPEAISDNETGLLVPPGDVAALAGAMLRLAGDPAMRARLGERAAQAVRERWSFERYVDRLESRFQELVNRPLARAMPRGRASVDPGLATRRSDA